MGPGKTVEFDGKGAGKVTFKGDSHKAFKCNDCHPALFKMKKGADVLTMKEMNAGKSCGTCHNGTKAFDVKDNANCGKVSQKVDCLYRNEKPSQAAREGFFICGGRAWESNPPFLAHAREQRL